MNILVAEDNGASARLLERVLKKMGHNVVVTEDGVQALAALQQQAFDAILTDWMMPNMDGIELIHRVRETVHPAPPIMVLTALDTSDAKAYALGAGADAYLAKPLDLATLLASLDACYARAHQPAPQRHSLHPAAQASPTGSGGTHRKPPFAAVCIAASTGGPTAAAKLLSELPAINHAALFMVQHGPAWMLEAYVATLRRQVCLEVSLARDGERARPGTLYLAPGDRHMAIDAGTLTLRLLDSAPENFVRPAADPLFRSVAQAFGRFATAIVLTGMGCDGARGAADIAAAGGVVMAQAPESAAVSAMPQATIDLGVVAATAPPAGLAAPLLERLEALRGELAAGRSLTGAVR